MSLALASLALTGAAAASAALPTSAAARSASNAQAQVGTVTVLRDNVKVRGQKVSHSADLSAGTLLVTDHSGHARLELKTKKTWCDVKWDVQMTVKPGGGFIWSGPAGRIYCATSPKSNTSPRRTSPNP